MEGANNKIYVESKSKRETRFCLNSLRLEKKSPPRTFHGGE